MNAVPDLQPDPPEFVEVDPAGRYGRYNEVLGKGASKTVYRAFDEYEGIEVAWNQVKLYDFLQSPEDLERLYREIHLLRTLKHSNIMKFYTSWVDTANRNINFVTELFTSGTLRQYRLKHKRVNIRAVKHWCRQILKGLLYLHSHEPPVIHRDLKCDNIFINGNQGEVKIGDLGLAAILRKSHAARCVGTPEFMAPEVYEEEYNELVDIYSFGMCILEMVTFEYPYSECTHPAQIYKRVISGKKPEALNKVKDLEVRNFVEKCLVTVSLRLPARELLQDTFLQFDDYGFDLRPLDYYRDFEEMGPMLRQPLLKMHHNGNSLFNDYSNCVHYLSENDLDYQPVECEADEINLFATHQRDDEHLANVDIAIKGRRRDDDGIFFRLRIADKEGRVRNISFPFDIETDTALSVAIEMVAELDMTNQDVARMADMIDGEIASLVPEWKKRLSMEESFHYASTSLCHNCASNGNLMDYISSNNPGAKDVQVLQCSRHGCAAVHGRFEEITYQFEGSEQCVTEDAPIASSQSDGMHYTDIWAQNDAAESCSQEFLDTHSDHEHESESLYQLTLEKDERIIKRDKKSQPNANANPSAAHAVPDDYENEIRRELRWLRARYQMQLRELKDQQLGAVTVSSRDRIQKQDKLSSVLTTSKEERDGVLLKSFASGKHLTAYFPDEVEKKCDSQRVQNYETAYGSCSPEHMVTAKSFYAEGLLPHSLHRATSLPVDAVDF